MRQRFLCKITLEGNAWYFERCLSSCMKHEVRHHQAASRADQRYFAEFISHIDIERVIYKSRSSKRIPSLHKEVGL